MLKSLLLAAAVVSVGLFLPAGTASATVASPLPVLSTPSAVQSVAFRGGHRRIYFGHGMHRGGWGWRRGWRGCGWRCHGGWGWGGAAIGIGLGGYYGGYYDGYGDDYGMDYGYAGYGYGDGHVRRCLARYRSYDPESDSFMGYDGERHPCRL